MILDGKTYQKAKADLNVHSQEKMKWNSCNSVDAVNINISRQVGLMLDFDWMWQQHHKWHGTMFKELSRIYWLYMDQKGTM